MPTNRQDAWSQDEDLLLAEVVLRQIREGGTQLQAFEEAGKRLSRTSAACGFRWNSFVRKQYKTGIELAKKQRKGLRTQAKTVKERRESIPLIFDSNEEKDREISFEDVFQYLKRLYAQVEQSDVHRAELVRIEKKMNELERENLQLASQNEKLMKELKTIEHDYKALIEIMERARKMVVLQEEDRQQKVKFQMDTNGNLERVEK